MSDTFELNQFKAIFRDFNVLQRHLKNATVNLAQSWVQINEKYVGEWQLTMSKLHFETFDDLWAYSKHCPVHFHELQLEKMSDATQWVSFVQLGTSPSAQPLNEECGRGFKTVKLIPKKLDIKYRPLLISDSPWETTVGDHTYRVLSVKNGSSTTIQLVCREDEDIYDYLDKGYCIKILEEKPKGNALTRETSLPIRTVVVANEYDINTAHIFAMLQLQPSLSVLLEKGCFINVYEAELVKLRMQKKLNVENRAAYAVVAPTSEEDYMANTTLLVVGKLMSGEIAKTTLNNILLSKTSAKYENVELIADDLLKVLFSKLNFNGEYDIYTIVDIYTSHVQAKVDAKKAEAADEPVGTDTEDPPEIDLAAVVEEEVPTTTTKGEPVVPLFHINGIPINVTLTTTGARYINNIRVLKAEIGKACYRASCHHTVEEYTAFLKSISRMCIKWHDVIANGIAAKIHDNISADEYNNPAPSLRAPVFKFLIDPVEKCVKLKVNEERAVKVQLNRLISRINTINARANNARVKVKGASYYAALVHKNHTWAATQLLEAFITCTTFKKKTGLEVDGVLTTESVTGITRTDLETLFGVVSSEKKSALQRSMEFMKTAVRVTGAEEIEFLGKKAYKVQGNLRAYAVVIDTAKVYDFDTKQYRCIVNSRHYQGAGYDDIATRLLALKNDSAIQGSIGTLAGAAQPQYENNGEVRADRTESEPENILARRIAELAN